MSTERLPWFPCYPTKLLAALAGMRPAEQLVYLIILFRIYESNGPCVDSLDALAVRTRYNKRIVSEALNSLFLSGRLRREGDGIINPVAANVLAEAKALRERRHHIASKGGIATAQKTKGNQSAPPAVSAPSARQQPAHLHLQLQDSLFPNGNKANLVKTEEADLFRRGREILGKEAGGLLKKLIKAKDGNLALARAAIEIAVTKNDPREYIGGVIRARPSREQDQTVDGRL